MGHEHTDENLVDPLMNGLARDQEVNNTLMKMRLVPMKSLMMVT